MTTTPIHTVLLDADGVLQWPADGWLEKWRPHAGGDLHAFTEELWRVERPALTGRRSIQEVVDDFLADTGRDPAARDEIVSAWAMIEVFVDAFELVHAIRAAGTRCHLATNQQTFRRDIMLHLGYADHFDHTFFSCDLGVAKPSPDYFRAILDRLGHGPEGVLFVDDTPANVEAARSVGIQAEVHDTHSSTDDRGIDDLRTILRNHGVDCG